MSIMLTTALACATLVATSEDAEDAMTEPNWAELSNEDLVNHFCCRNKWNEIGRRAAPFRDEIEAVAAHFNPNPFRAAGTTIISTRKRITAFLEQYVVLHGRMPEGEIYVKLKYWNATYDMYRVDFAKMKRP
jgi:hypothetical protein